MGLIFLILVGILSDHSSALPCAFDGMGGDSCSVGRLCSAGECAADSTGVVWKTASDSMRSRLIPVTSVWPSETRKYVAALPVAFLNSPGWHRRTRLPHGRHCGAVGARKRDTALNQTLHAGVDRIGADFSCRGPDGRNQASRSGGGREPNAALSVRPRDRGPRRWQIAGCAAAE